MMCKQVIKTFTCSASRPHALWALPAVQRSLSKNMLLHGTMKGSASQCSGIDLVCGSTANHEATVLNACLSVTTPLLDASTLI